MTYVNRDSCDGNGYVGSKTCPRCHGLGKVNAVPKPVTGKSKKGKRE